MCFGTKILRQIDNYVHQGQSNFSRGTPSGDERCETIDVVVAADDTRVVDAELVCGSDRSKAVDGYRRCRIDADDVHLTAV